MRIALAQILSGTDPAANLELVDRHTRQAAEAGASLVLFPEATMCGRAIPWVNSQDDRSRFGPYDLAITEKIGKTFPFAQIIFGIV